MASSSQVSEGGRLPAGATSPSRTVNASVLPKRLALRASSPLGVIDLQRSAQHYSRAAGWGESSLPLLNRLINRSRSDRDLGTGVGGGRVAVAASLATPDSVSTASDFALPAGPGLSHAAMVARGEPQQWQEGGLRSPLRVVTATDPRGASATAAHFGDHRASAAPETEPSVQPPPVQRVRRWAVPSAGAGSSRAGGAMLGTRAVERTRHSPGHAAEAGALAAVVSGQAPGNRLALPDRPSLAAVQIEWGRPQRFPLAGASTLSLSAANGAGKFFRAVAVVQPALREENRLATTSPLQAPVSFAQPAVSGDHQLDRGPPAPTPSPAAQFQRPLVSSTGAMRPPETTSRKVVDQELPVIPEQTAEASAAARPHSGLVLQRKAFASAVAAAGNPEAFATAMTAAVRTHQTADDGLISPGDSRPERSQPGAVAASSNPLAAQVVLDWEQVTAQVSRRILRQMSIERERRGWKRWN